MNNFSQNVFKKTNANNETNKSVQNINIDSKIKNSKAIISWTVRIERLTNQYSD